MHKVSDITQALICMCNTISHVVDVFSPEFAAELLCFLLAPAEPVDIGETVGTGVTVAADEASEVDGPSAG